MIPGTTVIDSSCAGSTRLDPRIHLEKLIQFNKLDCRVKPGNDAEIEGGRLPLA
jgi:hypothetical protein